jgi:hypothetical protein
MRTAALAPDQCRYLLDDLAQMASLRNLAIGIRCARGHPNIAAALHCMPATVEGGGHFFMGYDAEVRTEISTFVQGVT